MFVASICAKVLRCFSTIPPQSWISSHSCVLLGKTDGVTKKNLFSSSLFLGFFGANDSSQTYAELNDLVSNIYEVSSTNFSDVCESFNQVSGKMKAPVHKQKSSLLVLHRDGIIRWVASLWDVAMLPPSLSTICFILSGSFTMEKRMRWVRLGVWDSGIVFAGVSAVSSSLGFLFRLGKTTGDGLRFTRS